MPAIENISKQELAEHLCSLDTEARRWRFGYSSNDETIENYALSIPETDFILGIRESVTSNKIVAAVHLAIDPANECAEIGISTLLEARRSGLAERLMRYAVDILRNRGIRQMYSVCLPDNVPLLRLIQKLNITSITSADGDKQARISIPMAGIDSFYGEMQNQRMVIIDKSMRPWATMWQNILRVNTKETT